MSAANPPFGLRLCIPPVEGRGAGLGNELFGWAKAYLAAAELQGIPMSPAFGVNLRRYHEYFGTSRLDWAYHRLARKLVPRHALSEADYLSTGEVDYRRAVATLADQHGWRDRRFFLLETGGMWGGFLAIREAREFVRGLLLGARGTQSNLLDWAGRLDPAKLTVAVHIRAGDFLAPLPGHEYRGKFNHALPIEWYMGICRQLSQHFKGLVQFQLFTDGTPEALKPFIDEFRPVTGFGQNMNVCSDLLAMSQADLLVCSVSTFSLWAAFLSQAPYIWFKPQLQTHEGYLSLWGHEQTQQAPHGVTWTNLQQVHGLQPGESALRGVPVDRDDRLGDDLLLQLATRLSVKQPATDLALFGVVPDGVARDEMRVGT